jgi:hypothetical protein
VVAEAEVALAADPVEVACNAVVDQVEVACSEEADPAVADPAVGYNAAEVDPVAGWSVAVAVDLAAGFRPKAPPAVCSVKAQRWALMAAGA